MSLTLVTRDLDPVTLVEAKAQLRLEIDDDDDLVMQMLRAAVKHVEGQTRRALTAQTWDYAIDFAWPVKYGRHWITLPINPLTSVTSITYQDTTGSSPQPTLAASLYTVVAREHGSYIVPAYEVVWPEIRCVPNAATVRFEAGSDSDISEPLKQAILLLTAHLYENRDTATKGELIEIPYGVEALLSPYRPGSVA